MKNPIKTSIVAITILRTNPGIGMCALLELHVLEIIYMSIHTECPKKTGG